MIRSALIAAAVFCSPTAALAQEPTDTAPGAILRALDKVTGQTVDLELNAGQTVQYGRLSVRLHECRYPTGNRAGDAFAGVDIRETGHERPVFQGWMIASAPALSAMDHAQYDIWVMRCTTS